MAGGADDEPIPIDCDCDGGSGAPKSSQLTMRGRPGSGADISVMSEWTSLPSALPAFLQFLFTPPPILGPGTTPAEDDRGYLRHNTLDRSVARGNPGTNRHTATVSTTAPRGDTYLHIAYNVAS